MDSYCSNLGIAEHLHKMDRNVDNSFNEQEKLYRRFDQEGKKEDWLTDGKKTASIFKLRDDSYNRSKYSNPEDVLTDNLGNRYEGWGILSLNVHQITGFKSPVNLNGENYEIELTVSHAPERCNYAHAEVSGCIDNKKIDKRKKSVKVVIRDVLLGQCHILSPAISPQKP